MYEPDTLKWAKETFKGCDLGDTRRVNRLIDYAARQAELPDASTNAVCKGNTAAAEGAYRLIRNDAVQAEQIESGVFSSVAQQCDSLATFLLVQDTTTVSLASTVLAEQMHEKGGPDGFLVHSSLAVDPVTGNPLGLLSQSRWLREKERPGTSTRHQRPYHEKESYKWEQAQRDVNNHVIDSSKMVVVCDREADIFEFILYLQSTGQRFVLRASSDRLLIDGEYRRLREKVSSAPVIGIHEVRVRQRGPMKRGPKRGQRPGRAARVAEVQISSCTVTLSIPANRKYPASAESTRLNVVWVRESQAPEGIEPLDWLLLTSEAVETYEQSSLVIKFYERRWLIEEFHDSWKNGCRIEARAFQDLAHLQKIYTITAPIAVRLLQLRTLQDIAPETPCSEMLSEDEWQCLHATLEPEVPIPTTAPSVRWACISIARLSGWRDTQRTGRIGWKTMWKGWWTLQERLIGWLAAKRSNADEGPNCDQ